MKNAVLISLFFASTVANANVLTLQTGDGVIQEVKLAKAATATIESRVSQLTALGAGLRIKNVLFVHAKVYVAQLFANDATKFVRSKEGALGSLDGEKTVALQMNFVRSVGAGKVSNSFKEAFEKNHEALNSPEIQSFLAAVSTGSDIENGETLRLVGEKLEGGKELVTYENSKGNATSISGPAGFVKRVFAIWLGTPADSGLEDLKNALLAGK